VRILNERNTVLVNVARKEAVAWQQEKIVYPVYLMPEGQKGTIDDMNLYLSSSQDEKS